MKKFSCFFSKSQSSLFLPLSQVQSFSRFCTVVRVLSERRRNVSVRVTVVPIPPCIAQYPGRERSAGNPGASTRAGAANPKQWPELRCCSFCYCELSVFPSKCSSLLPACHRCTSLASCNCSRMGFWRFSHSHAFSSALHLKIKMMVL